MVRKNTLSPLFLNFAVPLTKVEETKEMELNASFWFVVMNLIC
jgi:hypothetical protein